MDLPRLEDLPLKKGQRVLVRIDLNVPYGTDLEQAKSLLGAATGASSFVHAETPPTVVVTQLGDNSVGLRLAFQARDYTEAHLARSEVAEAIYRSFVAAGIETPAPALRIIASEPKSGEPKP